MNILRAKQNNSVASKVQEVAAYNNMDMNYSTQALAMITKYATDMMVARKIKATDDNVVKALTIAVNRFNKVNG